MTQSLETLAQQQAAIKQIKEFEKQIEENILPSDLQDIFCRTISEESPEPNLYPAVWVQKKFVIKERGSQSLPDAEITMKIQNEMKNTLRAAKQGKPLAPADLSYVKRFEKHLNTFEMIQRANPSQTSDSDVIQQPTTEYSDSQKVTNVKQALQQKKIFLFLGFYTSIKDYLKTLVKNPEITIPAVLVVGVISASCIMLGILGAVLSGPLAVTILMFTLAALPFVLPFIIVLCAMEKNRLQEEVFKKASTPADILPLYNKLTPKARVECLVKLGPKFRKELLEFSKETRNDKFLHTVCRALTTLLNPNIPPAIKEETFESLTNRRDINIFFSHIDLTHLKKVLIEEKLLPSK